MESIPTTEGPATRAPSPHDLKALICDAVAFLPDDCALLRAVLRTLRALGGQP